MPNGSAISCVDCTYNRLKPGRCDVYGVETHGNILCRMFRYPKQSHTQARKKYSILDELEPGCVYGVINQANVPFIVDRVIHKTVPEENLD